MGVAFDLIIGARLAPVQNTQYEQLSANTMLPRGGAGICVHLTPSWLIGAQLDGTYNPGVCMIP